MGAFIFAMLLAVIRKFPGPWKMSWIILMAVAVLLNILNIASGAGLWSLKEWARKYVLVMTGLTVFYRFIRIFWGSGSLGMSSRPHLDEVNFWQPGGRQVFRALQPGQPFLFKLHSPDNYIVGGGFFTYANILPATLAWESLGEKNGASSWVEMHGRIEKYRRVRAAPNEDYKIGCILLSQPFFLSRDQWVPVPDNWSLNIVQGKTYAMNTGPGKVLWERLSLFLGSREFVVEAQSNGIADAAGARYGEPYLARGRLGQGSFRVMVTDNYQRCCAISGEKALPALEAAHIRPYGEGGEHRIDNGILLRADIHNLFDKGYVTITPDHRFEASQRLKTEFHNGHEYFALHGKQILLPSQTEARPNRDFLSWHNEHCFR